MFKHWVRPMTATASAPAPAVSFSAWAVTPSQAPSSLLSRQGFLARKLITFLAFGLVATPAAMGQSRGELLYTTHCIACHTTEMHWRDKRSANDWPALKAQVRRWQGAASLAWGDADILDVARYLNEAIYHFEQTADPVSSSGRAIGEPASTAARPALLRSP